MTAPLPFGPPVPPRTAAETPGWAKLFSKATVDMVRALNRWLGVYVLNEDGTVSIIPPATGRDEWLILRSTPINVKLFGAVGDGSADDTAAIVSAMSGMTAGDVLYLPRGTYVVNPTATYGFLVPAGCGVVGDGTDTVVKRGKTSTRNLFTLLARSFVRNLTLDGDYASCAAHTATELALWGLDAVAERVRIVNSLYISSLGVESRCTWRGCEFIGSKSATLGAAFGIWHDAAYEGGLIEGCSFVDYRLNAVFYGGAGRIVNNYFAGNHCQTSPTGGGQVCTAVGTNGLVIANNELQPGGAAATSGLELDGEDITVVGNYIDGQQLIGIVVQSANNVVISGNVVENCGQHGISVGAGRTGFAISGNRCHQNGGTYGGYGIIVAVGASDYYTITGNVLQGNSTGGLSDGGTGVNKAVANNV